MCKPSPRLKRIYYHMTKRCSDPSRRDYRWYGGKGISVCKEWLDDPLKFFLWAIENGYNDNLTIERSENSRGYCPDNCSWIPRYKQYQNYSQLRMISAFGESKHLQAWASDKRCIVTRSALRCRIEAGWFPEEAMATPIHKQSSLVRAARVAVIDEMKAEFPKEEEIWKRIPEWDAYEVSSYGQVRSYWRPIYENGRRTSGVIQGTIPRLLKQSSYSTGAIVVGVRKVDTLPIQILVSHLVLRAFVGPQPIGYEACHFPDPSPKNNNVYNLRWDTPSENKRDIWRLNAMARARIRNELS